MREHPCIGDICGRTDGIRCAEDECDIDLGIWQPPQNVGQDGGQRRPTFQPTSAAADKGAAARPAASE